MQKKIKIESPVYQRIAIDIVQKIVNNTYAEGQKLRGRSMLAANYNVSPETIRKAIHILKEVGVLDTEKGSGIEILSAEKASQFLERHKQLSTMGDIKNDILSFTEKIQVESSSICDKLQMLIDISERFKNSNPLTPFEIKVTADSPAVGKTLAELSFWHNTGATVVAIRRGEQFIISPGPYATFCENDVFFIIGNEASFCSAKNILSAKDGDNNSIHSM